MLGGQAGAEEGAKRHLGSCCPFLPPSQKATRRASMRPLENVGQRTSKGSSCRAPWLAQEPLERRLLWVRVFHSIKGPGTCLILWLPLQLMPITPPSKLLPGRISWQDGCLALEKVLTIPIRLALARWGPTRLPLDFP